MDKKGLLDNRHLPEIPLPPPRTNGKASLGLQEEKSKPKIPPRMKKRGPDLPEKPPHLRAINSNKSVTPSSVTSSQNHVVKEPNHQKLHPSNISHLVVSHVKQLHAQQQAKLTDGGISSKREVLVAASRGGREKPAEKRQREPAKLLTPTPGTVSQEDSDADAENTRLQNTPKNSSSINHNAKGKKGERSKGNSLGNLRKPRAPVLLIPRGHPLLDARNFSQLWGSTAMSYSMWVQRSGNGDPQVNSGLLRRVFGSSVDLRPQVVTPHVNPKIHQRRDTSSPGKSSKSSVSATSAKPRSSSVTRSGSLTSHGSTSSDSGNETFPKSVLKKQRRNTKNTNRPEQKKNVTFNAFATVQLMEE